MRSGGRAQHDAVMARLRLEGRLATGGQSRLVPLGALTLSAPAAPSKTPVGDMDEEGDLLRGVDPRSREADLLREARGMGWIGFHGHKTWFSKKGRWWVGRVPDNWGSATVVSTALEAMNKAWSQHSNDGHHPILDKDGPWTWSEQHKRVKAEARRLRKRYTNLGLPRPAQPVEDLGELRDREARAGYWMDRDAGVPENVRRIRVALREANAAHARIQFALAASAFWDQLPRNDPDLPRSPGYHTRGTLDWAKSVMRNRLLFTTSTRPYPQNIVAIDAALCDPGIIRELDAPVHHAARKRRDELESLILDSNR